MSVRMASASVGTLLTALLVTPLDVVKTRLQSAPVTAQQSAKVLGAAPLQQRWSSMSRSSFQGTLHSHPGFLGRAARVLPGELIQSHNCSVHGTAAAVSRPPMRTGVVQAACCRCMRQCHAGATVEGVAASGAAPVVRAVLAAPKAGRGKVTGVRHAHMSTWRTFAHLLRVEGPRSLYSGLSPTLLSAVPATALYYSLYDSLRHYTAFAGDGVAPLAAGMSARVVAATLVAPLELIRTRMQAAGYNHGMVSGLRAEVQSAGLRSLWRGLGPTLWRDVPFSGVYWLTYETLRDVCNQALPSSSGGGGILASFQEQFAASFVAGAGAGALAATLTTPFDVVKTQVQVVATEASHSRSISSVMRQIVLSRGVAGLFAGLAPRVAKVAPACAIMISSYEVGKQLLTAA